MSRFVSRLFQSLVALVEWLVCYMPGPLGRVLRFRYWKTRMKSLGRGVTFGVGVRISNPRFISIGDNSWIDDYVILLAGPPNPMMPHLQRKPNPYFPGREGEVVIGRNCHIAQLATLQGHGGLVIGHDSGVASGAKIYTLSHHYRLLKRDEMSHHVFKFSPRAPIDEQSLISSPVVMKEATALGLNSVVLPGSTIHRGSWVATLSVVSGEIPQESVASGHPAKVLKSIRQESC